MKAMVIQPKTETEFNFLSDLLKKLNVSTATISSTDLEDMGLAQMLQTVDKTAKVDTSEIIKKLKS